MNNNRWREVERIFDETLELPETDRAAFIAQACNGDQTLQHEVESLLAAHQQANGFLVASATRLSPIQELSTTVVAAQRLGPYQLLREIAQGGMGTVWLAERADDQFKQQVAIKLLKAGAHNSSIAGRLRHERQILADLNHPNIARLLDGGTTESGQPYLVMEYIEGSPIDEYCQQRQLGLRERLHLFRQVCAAVQYAHQHLIIHRDLKPANILVTADGTPKLLDFGIAKLLQPDLSQSYQTQAGQTPMTPAYASPEQIRGEKLTTASDVYSLGVVLYELLTGCSPYQLQENTFGELSRAICEQEPTRPSQSRKSEVRSQKPEGKKKFAFLPTTNHRPPTTALRGDLDSIVLMALRKEPTARYSSVEQFSVDMQRYLDGLPTLARKGTFAYRAVKYVRRYKVPVAAAALIVLSLLSGISATMRQARIAVAAQHQAESQRQRTENALLAAEERRQQSEVARAEANQQRGEAELQKILADEQRFRAEHGEKTKRQLLYAAQMMLARQAWESSDVERMRELLHAQLPQPEQQDLRGFEWYYLWRLAHSDLVTLKHTGQVIAIVLTPDGTTMASQTALGDIRIWNTATGKELPPIRDGAANASRLAISPNGKFFAQGKMNGQIKIYAVSNGVHLSTVECGQKQIAAITFSPDGKLLAAGTADGRVGVWAVPTWEQQAIFKASPNPLNSLLFTPDSKELLTGGMEGLIKMWDPYRGQELRVLPNNMTIYRLALIPGSNNVVSTSPGGGLKIWNFVTGQQIAQAKSEMAQSLSCSPDGSVIASGHIAPIVRLWNAKTLELLTEIKTHGGLISALAFTPDGKGLFTGSSDNTLKFRNVQRFSDAKLIAPNTTYITSVSFTRDGRRLISADEAQVIRIHDANTGRELQKLEGHQPLPPLPGEDLRMLRIAVSPAGRYFATGGYDKTIRTWDEQTGKPLQVFSGHARSIGALDISPDGRFIASGAKDTMVKIWDTTSGRELHTLRGHKNYVGGVTFSPQGKLLATYDGTRVIIWDYLKGIELTSIKSTADGQKLGSKIVSAIDFSPNGKLLAVSDSERQILLLETTTWQVVRTLKGHAQFITMLVFSPDGTRLASCGRDGTTKLWELEQGQEVLSLQGHGQTSILDLRFSPDGNSLATVGGFQLLVWPAVSPREVRADPRTGIRPLRATVSVDFIH